MRVFGLKPGSKELKVVNNSNRSKALKTEAWNVWNSELWVMQSLMFSHSVFKA